MASASPSIERRAFCAWLLCASCACSRTSNVANQRLRVGFIGTGEHSQPIGPEGWAHAHGTLLSSLAPFGVTAIDWVRFVNGPDLNEAMAAGALDLGIYGDTPALVGRAAGLSTRLFNQSAVGLDAWLLARADGPRSLAELPGRNIATSKGSYMHRYVAGLLRQMSLESRVQLSHLLPADAAAALRAGQIAAYAAPVSIAPLLVAEGCRVLDRASDHPGLSGSTVTVVARDFLERGAGVVSAWNRARSAAVRDVHARAEDYYAFHAQVVGLSVEVVRASYPVSLFAETALETSGMDLLQGTKRFLVEQHLAERDFSLNEWVWPKATGMP